MVWFDGNQCGVEWISNFELLFVVQIDFGENFVFLVDDCLVGYVILLKDWDVGVDQQCFGEDDQLVVGLDQCQLVYYGNWYVVFWKKG